jgi:hypothetical protein
VHVDGTHELAETHCGLLSIVPHPLPPPVKWHRPSPHEPHPAQPPWVSQGGLVVVVVLDVVVLLVVDAAPSGAQSIFEATGWSVRAPNWSVHERLGGVTLGHLSL